MDHGLLECAFTYKTEYLKTNAPTEGLLHTFVYSHVHVDDTHMHTWHSLSFHRVLLNSSSTRLSRLSLTRAIISGANPITNKPIDINPPRERS